MLSGRIKELVNLILILFLLFSYIYVLALGVKPIVLKVFIALGLIYLMDVIRHKVKSERNKTIFFFVVVAALTAIYLNSQGLGFIVDHWYLQFEYSQDSSFNNMLLFAYLSFMSGIVWSALFRLFLIKRIPR